MITMTETAKKTTKKEKINTDFEITKPILENDNFLNLNRTKRVLLNRNYIKKLIDRTNIIEPVNKKCITEMATQLDKVTTLLHLVLSVLDKENLLPKEISKRKEKG